MMVLTIAGLTLCGGCSRVQTLSGGTSTSENGKLAGYVADTAGIPEKGSVVTLVPAVYNPVKDSASGGTMTVTADEQGRYYFDSIPVGMYNIVASNPLSGARMIATGIPIIGDSSGVRADTMRACGAIRILLPGDADPSIGYVYVIGTLIKVPIATAIDDAMTIDSVPPGNVPALFYEERNGARRPYRLSAGVTVLPGRTAGTGYGAWDHCLRLYCNTTASGADVAGNAYGFPVLVRLTGNNFDFNQAASGGRDIRFSKLDNSPLPYEIEQWDSARAEAALWVRLDTVYGNNADQYFRMHWGNAQAMDSSNGSGVFDSSDGYQAVWHMQHSGGAPMPDVTVNHFDATAMGAIAPFDTAGYIGTAQRFSGVAGYFIVPNSADGALNFPESGFYTVSAWVMTAALDKDFHIIVSKGNEQYGLQINKSNYWEFFEFENNKGWDSTISPATPKTWTYLTGVREGKKQYLYVNGRCVDSTVKNAAGVMPRITTREVCIGKRPLAGNDTLSLFNGVIDEVYMADRAYSPDRIKLSFMNQKQNSLFIIFK
jgi:hypothetical protein